jgi:hypothetical protein
MDISPIVLRETSTSRLIFAPVWVNESDNSLRGFFRFERKSRLGNWEAVEHQTLTSLKSNEGYELSLKGEEVSFLLNRLSEINTTLARYGHSYGTTIVPLTRESAPGIFLQIGDINNREWVIEQLRSLESNNFENLGLAIGRARLEKAITDMEANLLNHEESFWQNFFEERPWVLQQVFSRPVIYLNGETYLGGKNSKGRQGSGGSATDFLFKNGSNGSFAVIEIKEPNCSLVGSCYRGEEGSGENNEVYRIHGDLSGGVVQMENQIHIATEYFKTQIGADFDGLNHLNPCGLLIAGTYEALTEPQKKSFDLFRKSLGKNQILTFDEIISKLKLLKSLYE